VNFTGFFFNYWSGYCLVDASFIGIFMVWQQISLSFDTSENRRQPTEFRSRFRKHTKTRYRNEVLAFSSLVTLVLLGVMRFQYQMMNSSPTPVGTAQAPIPRQQPNPDGVNGNTANLIANGQYLVSSTAKPWELNASGLNSAYEFGDNGGSDPTVLSLSRLKAKAGDALIIKYVSGQVSVGPGYPLADANGLSEPQWTELSESGEAGRPFPSAFIPTTPFLLGVLVGDFTDSTGQLVEPPFMIGDGPVSIMIPQNAAQLQLGINDYHLSDNTGAFVVSVTVAPPQQ